VRHPVDLGSVAVLRYGPKDVRFFTDGWGPEDLLEPIEIMAIPADPLAVTWLSEMGDEHTITRHGTFTSPLALLPSRARTGSVASIGPRLQSTRTVVLMPAWNEHEPRVGVAIARNLARRGIESIILENAYFGSRHPDPHSGHPIRTVADFMVMGASACIEARGLLAAIRENGRTPGVAGYSMGGNTAALVTATVPFPVASAPLAASHSPAPVFLDGVLRHGIAWDALGGPEQATRLRSVLGRVSVLHLDPPDHVRHAIIVGARSDGYIPASATRELADHWTGSTLRWEPGGHATLVWLRKERLAKAIIDAFDRVGQSRLR
jgi:hypothetical protein